jgi:M3 family oligoendopeptidase
VSTTDFEKFGLPAPTYDDVAAEYAQIGRGLDSAATGAEAVAVVERWDNVRRHLISWSTLVKIRFHQDTQNEQYKKAQEYCDELEPKLTNLAVQLKRQLRNSPHRDAIANRFGAYAFDLWECDIAAFEPAIENDLVEQAKLVADYTELLSSGKFEFQGETLTLSQMMKFNDHADRDVRHDAAFLRWKWFGEHQGEFDSIYDKLVRVRQTMAGKLRQKNFIRVGYQRMQRVDYDEADVERFRAQVREHVVPLASAIRQQQERDLGVDPLMAWDESLHDPAGNPKPQGDHDWMVRQASKMFAELGGGMDVLYERMRAANLMDLKSREGKAGGGFCDAVLQFGVPFIYANFDGTMKDSAVFTHEMGHAFQMFCSINKPLVEYTIGTAESCEIHSMGLEFLSWPQMRFFFGDDARRYCRMQLTQMLLFFPYGVAVDHFQHRVYDNPNCSPDDRAQMWQQMERTYLPTLKWGDLAHPASGRRWQAQLHIYTYPFYYIDYTLALTCALQLWVRAAEDRQGTIDTYVRLCQRGGEAPFGELVKSAGLVSPFEDGCLERAVEHARRELAATA